MIRAYNEIRMGAARKVNAKRQMMQQRMRRFHMALVLPPVLTDGAGCAMWRHQVYLRARREQVQQSFEAYPQHQYRVVVATMPKYVQAYEETAAMILAVLADAMDVAASHLLEIEITASLPSGYCAAAVAQVCEVEHVRKQD